MRGPAAIVLVAVFVAGCGGSGPSAEVAEGRAVYGATCSACHGSAGEGGVGPSLARVLETWPSCTDHRSWIALGSEGWLSGVGDTYGADGKPVQGGMPAHAAVLTEREIAAVAAFERIVYGGAEETATLAECGLTG